MRICDRCESRDKIGNAPILTNPHKMDRYAHGCEAKDVDLCEACRIALVKLLDSWLNGPQSRQPILTPVPSSVADPEFR